MPRPYAERLGLAITGELRQQTLRGTDQVADGAPNFVTSSKSVTQDYQPMRLRIGTGRGVNTQGAQRSSGDVTQEQFEGKSQRTPMRRSRQRIRING